MPYYRIEFFDITTGEVYISRRLLPTVYQPSSRRAFDWAEGQAQTFCYPAFSVHENKEMNRRRLDQPKSTP